MAVPDPARTPAPHGPTRYFTGLDDRGYTVTLAFPIGGDLRCGSCSARDGYLAAAALADTDVAEDLLDLELAEIAACAHDGGDFEDPAAALYPASGSPGHDCSTAFCGPVWMVRTEGSRPQTADLADALTHLPHSSAQDAMDAHLRALRDVGTHLTAATALADTSGDAPTGDVAEAAVCLACLVDVDAHVIELHDDLERRTLELAAVLLRHHDVELVIHEPGHPSGSGRRQR